MHPGNWGPWTFPWHGIPSTPFIAQYYGLLKTKEGISFRGPFIMGNKGVLCQMTSNDLSLGCSVDEILRVVQASEGWTRFTDKGDKGVSSWLEIPSTDTSKLMSQRAETISPSRSSTLNCVYTGQKEYPGKENLFGALFLLKHKTWCDSRHAFPAGLGKVSLPSTGGNGLSYAVGDLHCTSSRASTDCSFVMSSEP